VEDVHRDAEALIEANGWRKTWGDQAMGIIFAYGLAYLERQAGDAEPDVAPAEDPREEQIITHGAMYAVMKQNAYQLARDREALEMRAPAGGGGRAEGEWP